MNRNFYWPLMHEAITREDREVLIDYLKQDNPRLTNGPKVEEFEDVWNERAPLFWDVADPVPAAQGAVALLSPFFPKTTGEIIHVDGGVHAIGS